MKTFKSFMSAPLFALLCFGVQPDADAALIGYYTFENNANDVSGNGNHGSFSPTAPVFTANGYSGGAYRFGANGTDTFITVPIDINPAVLPQLTMGGWVKAEVADEVIRGVISHDDGGFDRGFGVDTRNGGVRWCMFIGTGGADSGHCGYLVDTNEWAFIAASYNQATGAASMMVNDYYYEYASGELLGPSVLETTTIGRNPGFDLPFIGLIDNVFFFDEYLNEQALIDIRDNGIGVPEPPVLALLALAALGLRMRHRRR